MLIMIKVTHTLIWLVMALATLYIFFCGLTGKEGWLLWLSIILLSMESVILIANGWRCPLSSAAAVYTNNKKDNFDIYLPEWLAKHNKTIFGAIFITGLALVIIRGIF